jgi:hypothetical protein
MNERIKELLKQSGGVHSHGYECGEPINRVVFSVDALEKFAELIVMECADLVQTYMSRLPEDHELTKQIKEHFGVTE